jgi:hypothetical protein
VNSTFNVEFSGEDNRVDSVIYNSFYVPSGTTNFYMAVPVTDDITPLSEMLVNKLYLSTSVDDFSAAQIVQATYFEIPGQAPIWIANVSTTGITPGTIYYMRYGVNDGHHVNNTVFPEDASNAYYKSYWSFILQP